MSIFPCWLDVMYKPRSSVYVTRISLGSMIYADELSTSSRRLIFGGPVIALWLIGKFVHCQVRANETYLEAKHQFSLRNIYILMNVQSPHNWWSTLKSAVFGSSSSLPPLVGPVGDWCVSRLGRLIFCQIILTASSAGSLLICWSRAIRLLV